jgi:plastocyanin
MRIFQRRSLNFISGSVALAALALLLASPRPMVRPPPHPMPPGPHGPALRPALPARPHPQPLTNVRPRNTRAANFNSSFSTPTAFGPASFSASASASPSARNFTLTSSTPFGSFNFHSMASLGNSFTNFLTLSRSLSLSETINGRTANFSTNGSVTLTAAQVAAGLLARQMRHSQLAALRQAQLASVYQGSGFPMTAYPYTAMGYGGYGMGYGGYGGGGYGGGGYGGGGYGGGASSPGVEGAVPGLRVAGSEENRQESPVDRVLAASGVTDAEGHLLWPVGLRALPGTQASQLRERVDSLLTQGREEAAGGSVRAPLFRDLTSAVDDLRKQLLRDREERFSLTYQAYEDAEDYLAKLKRAAKQLKEAGESLASLETQTGKPAGRAEVMDVGLTDNRFEPPTVSVPAGTTVRWTNRGQHKHTVMSDMGDWGSKELGPKAVYEYTFTQPGTYAYHCEVHPKEMRGTVVVK